MVAAGRELLEGVRVFGLPVLGTEQYPKGIGRTVPQNREGLEANRATVLEKMTFSACREPAIGSRGRLDYEQSLHRMRQAGAFVTTVESALFELCDRCGTDQFKAMLDVIKAHPPADD